ncbi:MAG: thioredoxin-disulfide reductase [Candidatus Eisenbacteria bacterium]|uniref:Thioredoxin reductase n=1 Tax=Eiseniibacteriota bacterium TaxID=2212470 RepID=A0A7Y2E890_UNCEI|nr:thioredoxin-disulfide reductase [Candidatus Eisenbacteria bacterium]
MVIIGSGPAGFTAALYAARANLNPLVIEGSLMNERGEIPGGQLMTTTDVENYPGFPDGLSGPEMMDKFRDQAKRFGARMVQEDVEHVELGNHPFKLRTSEGTEYETLSVIIATGARAKKLDPKGGDTYWQKGISACAVCDGALPLFREKPLVVIGGGDTAMEEASFLAKYGSKVYVVHRRDEFRASAIMQERVLKNPKTEVVWNSNLVEVEGDGNLLKKVTVESTVDGSRRTIEAAGLFYAIGHIPNTDFLKDQIETNETGYIVLKDGQQTSVKGVFAAGDVHDFRYRQAVTAAGAGCAAALDAEHFLGGLEHEQPQLFETLVES